MACTKSTAQRAYAKLPTRIAKKLAWLPEQFGDSSMGSPEALLEHASDKGVPGLVVEAARLAGAMFGVETCGTGALWSLEDALVEKGFSRAVL